MKKRAWDDLRKWGIPKYIFWNGELEYVFEHRYENRHFVEFFIHICNYLPFDKILSLLMNDTRLRLLTWDNVAFIFCIMKKDRLTYFHYDVMNAFLERTGTDERVNKDHLYKLPEICKIDDMVKEFLWKKWEKDDKIRKMNIIEEQKNKINILKKWGLIN